MRSPEDGHSPACWVRAMKMVLDEERDYCTSALYSGATPFRIWLQDNGPLHYAEEALNGGYIRCICTD